MTSNEIEIKEYELSMQKVSIVEHLKSCQSDLKTANASLKQLKVKEMINPSEEISKGIAEIEGNIANIEELISYNLDKLDTTKLALVELKKQYPEAKINESMASIQKLNKKLEKLVDQFPAEASSQLREYNKKLRELLKEILSNASTFESVVLLNCNPVFPIIRDFENYDKCRLYASGGWKEDATESAYYQLVNMANIYLSEHQHLLDDFESNKEYFKNTRGNYGT